MRAMRLLSVGVALISATAWVGAQSQPAAPAYQLPPQVIVDILDAPPPPQVYVSPARDVVAQLERASMPSIAELAQPMLRLAGLRIHPGYNGPHRAQYFRSIAIKGIEAGDERAVTLPEQPRLSWVGFSPDGARFAFTQTRDTGIELWVGDSATGEAKSVTVAQLNAVFGTPCAWTGEGASLVCAFTLTSRGAPPAAPAAPTGPNIQQTLGRTAPVRTYQDLLANAHDEALFEYYATSQLALVDATTGARAPLGRPGLFSDVSPSPSGDYVLVTRLKRPFSWLVPYRDFPQTVEILDRKGTMVKLVADLPLADTVPNNGVLPGPRAFRWHPTAPATLAWAEALDGGDPSVTVPHRDRVLMLAAPFSGDAAEMARTEHRFRDLVWTETGVALLTDYDRRRRWTRTWIIDAPGAAPRTLWDRSAEDRYGDPGTPVRRMRGSNVAALQQSGDAIFLTGAGASPEGDRPFLDRLNLRTLETERLFQSAAGSYEPVLALLNDDGSRFVTRHETKTSPPNVIARTAGGDRRALTAYTDPAPALQGVQKQLITYARPDGVQLSATLYTPPGWTPAQGRLPVLFWAYPREFVDPAAASQVQGSPDRFTLVSGPSHMLFLTQGYAILDDPAMPIVGPGETANDTYIEQLVASAQAAVDTVVEMGVGDRDRVVAGGHSYGAFMTANLLAHSDIFRAGLARSGAYNRTLTPFGFQNEQRTFWEVPEIYGRMSPFYHAHKIKAPVLLTHGEADNNSGTFPIQSERMYMALKGHGATVRYVTLPHESHGYAARESVLHTVYEMLAWADTYAKHAGPRDTSSQRR
ncbi:MAG: prolyl oligopeptidase family serine peptidase [Vicinamibacterales bacterium]|nr:prolyl oligopeptidase family serine peptidase [Vicinamibacterales bacterium]